MVRASVEIGLLALALTPVIVTGGIDLSVGSLMGLCAVVFGRGVARRRPAHRRGRAAGLVVGGAGGLLNALLVAGCGIPPLIVTLGTYLALPRPGRRADRRRRQLHRTSRAGFLFLGQGPSWAACPRSCPLLVAGRGSSSGCSLHRTAVGRGLRAIGFSPEGARYAGMPVARRLALVYVLSGLCAGLAAVVYVARLGQAKADAGTGYELLAITAVVLGGTSIFGGRGHASTARCSGSFAIAVLQNGLRLADLPAELAGILTGVLLLGAIGANGLFSGKETTHEAKLGVAAAVVLGAVAAVGCRGGSASGGAPGRAGSPWP